MSEAKLRYALPLVVLFVSLWARVATAHDPFETTTRVTVAPGGIELRMVSAKYTVEELLGREEAERLRVSGGKKPPEMLYELSSGGRAIEPILNEVRVGTAGEEEGDFVFSLRFAEPTGRDLSIRARYLESLSGGYTGAIQVGTASPAKTLAIKVLHAGDATLKVELPSSSLRYRQALRKTLAPRAYPEATATFLPFLRVGVTHALLGYDHLLFLLSVLLGCLSVGRVLLVLSTFTLAHSVTLSLAALHFVSLSSAIVEPLIALSIAVAAFFGKNMERRGLLLPVTFSFGLVHGLGFASGLETLGADPTSRAFSLVGFNCGVEIAQVAVAAGVFPLLVWWRARAPSAVFLERIALLIGSVGSLLFVLRLAAVL